MIKPLLMVLLILLIRTYLLCGFKSVCEAPVGHHSLQAIRFLQTHLEQYKQSLINNTYKYLPSPHAELLLGMTSGIDLFKNTPRYNDILKETGLVHVVVVSGFNINLIINFFLRVVGDIYSFRKLIVVITATLIYALFTGFEPPVVRACFMSLILLVGKYYGRPIYTLQVLLMTGMILCCFYPYYLYSLSFQLSFLATLSLTTFSGISERIFSSIFGVFRKSFFVKDLSTTVAAQLLVLPLIAYKFSVVSLISPVSNALLLWIVPIATVLGIFLLLSYNFIYILAEPLSYIVYIFLDIFVKVSVAFSKISYAQIPINFSFGLLVTYYFILSFFVIFVSKKVFKNE